MMNVWWMVVCLVLVQWHVLSEEVVFDNQQQQEEEDNNTNVIDNNNKWAHMREHVLHSIESYKDCGKHCFKKQIRDDLYDWSKDDGTFNRDAFNSAVKEGQLAHYQYIDGHLYRSGRCMFTMRCEGIEYFIKKALHSGKIPNMEWLVNVRDNPTLPKNRHIMNSAPVLSFSKTSLYRDIMYPAWAFWKGGPCLAKVERQCLGRWDLKLTHMLHDDNVIEWDNKEDIAFFRGSRTNKERDPLVRLSLSNPLLVDAKYVKNQSWRSNSDSMGLDPVEEVSLEDHCRYKYLFNFRGVAASFRHRHLFLCNSLVFHVGNEWLEFYYNDMKPWVHYIPVSSSDNERELKNMLEFARENPDLAQQIAQNGHDFIVNHLKMEDVSTYWRRLLLKYSKLQTWNVDTVAENAIKIM